MFKCDKCRHVSEVPFKICPDCSQRMQYTDAEIKDYLYLIHKAYSAKKYEVAVIGYRALADIGHTPSAVAYAKILEEGRLVPQDKESAAKYYYEAALENDAFAAYRYAHLVREADGRAYEFWLLYSAILGLDEAYPDVARLYSDKGDEVSANYYYALAADTDSVSAAMLAQRYYNGIGTDPSDANAKWYLEKLKLPALRLPLLTYKLRATAAEPPKPIMNAKTSGLAAHLTAKAKEYKYDRAYFNLVLMMSKSSNAHLATLGRLYTEGVGCEKDIYAALEILKRAASLGEIEAYKYLGGLYLRGELVPQNTDEAIDAYAAAAKLGDEDGYEIIADIYAEGEYTRRDLAKAIEYYDKASGLGNCSAYKKGEELKDERERFFESASEFTETNPALAFKNYAISAGMGYAPAYIKLAECYKRGIGTKSDRQRAFMWYEYAARGGDGEAFFELGLCYAYGIGTAFDYEKAIKTLNQAKNRGCELAEGEMLRLMENKRRSMAQSLYSASMRLLYQRKHELAKKILDACAELDYPKAVFSLGCFYEFGVGTSTDRDKAFSLYERAYKLGFNDRPQRVKHRILRSAR